MVTYSGHPQATPLPTAGLGWLSSHTQGMEELASQAPAGARSDFSPSSSRKPPVPLPSPTISFHFLTYLSAWNNP